VTYQSIQSTSSAENLSRILDKPYRHSNELVRWYKGNVGNTQPYNHDIDSHAASLSHYISLARVPDCHLERRLQNAHAS
jgi:hypothetical protein